MTDLVLKAPPGKYRVICVDTFDGTDWIEGDYDDRDIVLAYAKKRGEPMLKVHVYDEHGLHIGEGGTF